MGLYKECKTSNEAEIGDSAIRRSQRGYMCPLHLKITAAHFEWVGCEYLCISGGLERFTQELNKVSSQLSL